MKKRILSIMLTICMIVTLMPTMVYADENTSAEPSVSTYATKDQLMDGTFAPNADGIANNIGKLVFGKNSSGEPQGWYILGKDTGVDGDNTIIFAASPITTNQVFNESTNNKTYTYEAGTGYGDTAGSKAVYPNHYGASYLRVALRSMVTDTNYFTTAEQGMMNATTVTTSDLMTTATSSDLNYTTTDKLYALQGDYNNGKYLWAGTSDSTVLDMESYCSNGVNFWLRSPFNSIEALTTGSGDSAHQSVNNNEITIQPASNLNLSSVLFASAAKAATSSDLARAEIIDLGVAMTLRLDGSGKNIGTVTYNTTSGDIKAAKGSTTGDVMLVVQGSDGTSDWYYSKPITTADTVVTVNESEIQSAFCEGNEMKAIIDLATSKIWLETTDADGMIYAVNANEEVVVGGKVEAPTASYASGTYESNLSVTLTSSTEGATIYYTTDGSEPIINGEIGEAAKVYESPIEMTQAENRNINITIKAVAIKDGMDNSTVETFSYNILGYSNSSAVGIQHWGDKKNEKSEGYESYVDSESTYNYIPEKAVISQLNANLSTTVKMDRGAYINKDIFSALAGKNTSLTFTQMNGNTDEISYTFYGNHIKEIKSFNTGVSYTSPYDEQIKSIAGENVKILNFDYSGTLPGPAKIKVNVSDTFKTGTKTEVGMYNEETNTIDYYKFKMPESLVEVDAEMISEQEEDNQEFDETVFESDGSQYRSMWLTHFSIWVISEKREELDLSAYSNYGLNLYENSRVTSVAASANGFDVDGYMWIDGEDATTNTWREIVFVNSEDADTSKAYRKSVTPVYNTWLNNNMTATKNGEISLDYANYEVTVDPTNIQNYTKTSTGAMASGTYLVYMRISDGKDSYLFPLVDRDLSDGTSMESTGTLPEGFSVADADTRTLVYTVK